MSENHRKLDGGVVYGPESRPGNGQGSRGTTRSMMWCFASGSNARIRCGVSDAGIAHTFAVCMLELETMARGGGKGPGKSSASTMPKFVDIKLTQEDKADFLRQNYDDKFLVTVLQSLCDDGYRVGCVWDAERQAYVVSLTCRNSESENNGLCMTSFGKNIRTAVGLAVYKHTVLTEERWLGEAGAGSEDFG